MDYGLAENGLALADYLIVAGFFIMMLAIGVFFAGRMKNLKDFFGGGSQIPWWVSSVSLYMSTFSAFAFVAYSATAYQHGFVAIAVWWSGVPCWLFSARFLAARWRRAASTSPLEFIETRYGPNLRQGFAWFGIPTIIIDDALKLFVIGKMVTVSLGVSQPNALPTAIAICGSIMLAYTFLGGLWAVMVTDFIQFVVMATAVIVLIPLVLIKTGGLGPVVSSAPEGYWHLTGGDFTWIWLLSFMVIQLFSYSTRWSLVQRYYSVKTDKEARKVGYLCAALTFFGVPLLFFPAMAARLFMPGIEDDLNAVYPLLCKELLPVGMMGMMIAAMFSATMSMLSSDYNAVASVITNDVYKRLFARTANDKALVFVGRIATLAIGIIALGAALFLAGLEKEPDLVKTMARLFSILLPPFAVPMIFGLLTRRTSYAGGLAGFLCGATCGLTAYALGSSEALAHLRSVPYITWITTIPTLLGTGIVSFLIPDSPAKRERVAHFLDGLEAADPIGPAEPSSGATANLAASAIQIIGMATAGIGILLALSVLLTGAASTSMLSIAVGAIMLILGAGSILLARRLAQRSP